MSLVLDSSVTIAWCFADEVTPAVETVFDRIGDTGAVVPTLWRLEVANALQSGVRRGRLSPHQRDRLLALLADLDIRSDMDTDRYAWNGTLRLSERYRLSLYDAAYLELALRLALPLATLDAELRTAADAVGLQVLGA